MNVVGRKYQVGRVRSRPSTRLRPSGLQQSPTADQRLRTFCRAPGLGWPLGVTANGL